MYYRKNMKKICKFFLLLIFAACSYGAKWQDYVRDGDLIFQISRSAQSIAIQRATNSPYSHMGVILFKSGKPYVFEAVTTVRYTLLSKWIARGEGYHFVVKRLKNAKLILTTKMIERIRSLANKFSGRPYDLIFEWSDQRLYCSELVWKLFDRAVSIRIGKLQKLGDFNLSDPVVKAKLKERYGRNIPLNEPVISPSEMFGSNLLETILEQ
jgi:hypothetical protein